MISIMKKKLPIVRTGRVKHGAKDEAQEAGGPLLNQTTVYALRAMARLATLPSGESARGTDLAEQTGVPLHYLAKVLRRLVAHGLLVAQRGHGGGFALARPPNRMRFFEILAALDQMPAPDRCAFGWGRCDPHHPCPLHPAWSKLNASFRTWALSTTLADVAE